MANKIPGDLKQAIAQDDSVGFGRLFQKRVESAVFFSSEVIFDQHGWMLSTQMPDYRSALAEKFEADYTYMHFACELGSVSIVRYLCQLGSPTSLTCESGTTAIHLAVDSNRFDCILEMSKYGVDLNCPDGWHGNTPLHWATHRKNFRMLEVLLYSGANPNIPNNEKNLPIHMAARTGDYSCLEVLIQGNTDLEALNGSKQTALQIAEKFKFDQCILLLRNPPPVKKIELETSYALPPSSPREQTSFTAFMNSGNSSETERTNQSIVPVQSHDQRRATVTSTDSDASQNVPASPRRTSNLLPSFSRRSSQAKSDAQDDPNRLSRAGSRTTRHIENFASKLNTWQELVSFIMSPISSGSECTCIIEREPGLTDMYSLLLKQNASSPKNLLLHAYKRKKSASPNYPIGLTKRDVTERNTPGYLGKIRGNTLREEYIAYNSGLNPDRRVTIGRLAVRAELAILRIVGKNPRQVEISVPNPDASGPDMLVFGSKTPEWDEANQFYTLPFSDKVTLSSKRNTLVVPKSDGNLHVFELGKFQEHCFYLTFQYPFSPFQAFALALGIFDCT